MLLITSVHAEDYITSNVTDFSSVQKLIDDAQSSDEIHLENVTYGGSGTAISIDKDISVVPNQELFLMQNQNPMFCQYPKKSKLTYAE